MGKNIDQRFINSRNLTKVCNSLEGSLDINIFHKSGGRKGGRELEQFACNNFRESTSTEEFLS